MGKSVAWVGAMLLFGCSAESVETSSQAVQVTSCRKEDRSGTYLMTYAEQSGSCGPIDSELVSFDDAADGNVNGTDCVVDAERWTDGDCKLTRSVTCVRQIADPVGWRGYGSMSAHVVAATRQMAADGSRLEGVATFTIETTSGDSCKSTYAVTATRQ